MHLKCLESAAKIFVGEKRIAGSGDDGEEEFSDEVWEDEMEVKQENEEFCELEQIGEKRTEKEGTSPYWNF